LAGAGRTICAASGTSAREIAIAETRTRVIEPPEIDRMLACRPHALPYRTFAKLTRAAQICTVRTDRCDRGSRVCGSTSRYGPGPLPVHVSRTRAPMDAGRSIVHRSRRGTARAPHEPLVAGKIFAPRVRQERVRRPC